jgi:crossover junction endodeoxyribonuclease RuvC
MKLQGQAGQGNEAVQVLGVDPGLAITGYGLLKVEDDQCSVLDYGCIRTPAGQELPLRLLTVFEEICALIDKYVPTVMAVEQLFFCKNVRTATQVGEARGAILTAAAVHNVPIVEYTPLQIKQAVAGYGKAEKKQVQQMVSLILRLAEPPQPDDAADALAVALCYLQSRRWHEVVQKGR